MGLITVVVPSKDEWYFRELLAGITNTIEAAGHRVQVRVIALSATSSIQATTVVDRDFASPDCLGAIAAGFRYRPDQIARAANWRRSIVVIGNSTLGFPTVSIDDIGAGMTLTQHLIHLGHTRIVHLTGGIDPAANVLFALRRAKGYRLAMEGAGLEPIVVETPFEPDAVGETVRHLLGSPRPPSALFAVTDEVAFSALRVIRELGLRVGRDISIAGIDDDPRAEAEDLTTIRQRPAEIGAKAAELVLAGLSGGQNPRQSSLHATTFVRRGSTQPPP